MPTGVIHAEEANCYFLLGRYTCYSSGEIYDKYTEKAVEDYPKPGGLLVEVLWPCFHTGVSQSRIVERALVLALAFKRCNVAYHLIHRLDVMYADGDSTNISLNNLILKYPEGGLEHPSLPGFYYIPGFSRYAINRDGLIISLNKNVIKTGNNTRSYLATSMSSDSGKDTAIGIHRALALTFIPYRPTVTSDVVNHLDGVPDNNAIENLEWCTQQENIIHGFKMKRENSYGIPQSVVGLQPIPKQQYPQDSRV